MKKKRGGWGRVYKDVTRNKNISAAAKGLYAYLAAMCGLSEECYPTVDTIVAEMGFGKDTFYRKIGELITAGVVEKKQILGLDGRFGRTIYKLTHEVKMPEKTDFPYTDFPETAKTGFPYTDFPETVKPETDFPETIKNNIINNNNKKEQYIMYCPEPENSAPDGTGIGINIPLNDGTFYNPLEEKITCWQQAYPAVDIKAELYKVVAWCDANPTKRKTKRGVERFLNNWLDRAQNRSAQFAYQKKEDSYDSKKKYSNLGI